MVYKEDKGWRNLLFCNVTRHHHRDTEPPGRLTAQVFYLQFWMSSLRAARWVKRGNERMTNNHCLNSARAECSVGRGEKWQTVVCYTNHCLKRCSKCSISGEVGQGRTTNLCLKRSVGTNNDKPLYLRTTKLSWECTLTHPSYTHIHTYQIWKIILNLSNTAFSINNLLINWMFCLQADHVLFFYFEHRLKRRNW